MIQITNLSKAYSTQNGSIRALDDINLTLNDTGMVFILGKSGSGKTTLLNLMAGIDSADSGSVRMGFLSEGEIGQDDVLRLTEEQLDIYHNIYVGIIFQDYYLINEWSVEDNINIALQQQEGETQGCLYQKTISQMLENVGLYEVENRKIYELSGGQAQRVAIARALIKNPKVIFADEPTGNLDTASGKHIFQILKEASKERLVVVVSHDEEAALAYGDRIIRIVDGKIESDEQLNVSNGVYKIKIFNYKTKEEVCYMAKRRDDIKNYICQKLFEKMKNEIGISIDYAELEGEKKEFKYSKKMEKIKEIPFNILFRLALQGLSKRKLRISIIVLVLMVSLSFFQFIVGLGIADIGRPIAKYIIEKNIREVYLQETISYENSFFEREYVTRGVTPKIVQVLKKDWNDENVEMCCADISIRTKSEESTALVSTNLKDLDLKNGRLPKEKNEICITDFLAYFFDLEENCLNQRIILHNVEFIICGVIETHYEETGLLDRIINRKTTQMDEYNLKYLYRKVYCCDDFQRYVQENALYICIEASDFTIDTEKYLYSTCNYANVNLIETSDIMYGKYPEAANEVLVSYNFAITHDLLVDDGFVEDRTFDYKDIYDKKYNGAYAGLINMRDMLETVKVVGVVLETTENAEIDIWINENIYQEIEDYYFNNVLFNVFEVETDTMPLELLRIKINNLFNSNITLDEPMVSDIYRVYEIKTGINNLIYVLEVVFLVLVILLDVSYVSYNVNDNRNKIGILRTLGVNKTAVMKIYMCESVIISILSFGLSCVGTLLLFEVTNNYLSKQNETDLVYFIQNEWVTFLALLFILVIGVINVISPIVGMIKVPPIRLIKSFD